MTDETNTTGNPFLPGDPVMDGAQGRPMIVLDAPEQNVAEWSGDNNYDLLSNYANSRFDPDPDEYVVECVYVSDVRSEPSKSYTFPVSRVWLIDAHRADDGPDRRLRDRIVSETLERLLDTCPGKQSKITLMGLIADAGFDGDVEMELRELADVEQQLGIWDDADDEDEDE